MIITFGNIGIDLKIISRGDCERFHPTHNCSVIPNEVLVFFKTNVCMYVAFRDRSLFPPEGGPGKK